MQTAPACHLCLHSGRPSSWVWRPQRRRSRCAPASSGAAAVSEQAAARSGEQRHNGVTPGPCSGQGAVAEDGRSPSIWDTWAAAHPAVDSPNVTDDFYHQWAGDIAIMQRYGIKHFRFSVAWTRVMPDGNGSVNAAGMAFYSRVVDALLAAGIEPVVTLYHWDLPQARHPAARRPPQLPMHAPGTGKGRHAHGPLMSMHAEPPGACAARPNGAGSGRKRVGAGARRCCRTATAAS